MILSNLEIVQAIKSRKIEINSLAEIDPALPPFNTSSVDLRLAPEISVPKQDAKVTLRPSKGGLAHILANNSENHIITSTRPFLLEPNCLILGKTKERVNFRFQKMIAVYVMPPV